MEGLRKTGSCKTMQLPVSLKEVRFLGNDYIGAHTRDGSTAQNEAPAGRIA